MFICLNVFLNFLNEHAHMVVNPCGNGWQAESGWRTCTSCPVKHFGELRPLCLAMVIMKGTETEHHQHTGHVICSSKLPLHGRSISRRACAHTSPNWTRLWCIGALALHLWAITEMHRQWWRKTPGGQTEQSVRGGLQWPAFMLNCFRANCPTNRRAQTPPVAHHALQREGGIYSPLSNWSACCLTTVH